MRWNGRDIRGVDVTLQKDADGHLNDRLDAGLLVAVDLVYSDIVLAVAGRSDWGRHGGDEVEVEVEVEMKGKVQGSAVRTEMDGYASGPVAAGMKLFKEPPSPKAGRGWREPGCRPPPKPAGLDGRSLPLFILSPRDS